MNQEKCAAKSHVEKNGLLYPINILLTVNFWDSFF